MIPIHPAFVGIPGGPELLVVLLLAVLLFGASKLPALARSLGTAEGEFRKGRAAVERELEQASPAPPEQPTAGTTERSERAGR